MNENTVSTFAYPSESLGHFCEEKAQRVTDIRHGLVRVNVRLMWEMGRCLNEVKAHLPHGSYQNWEAWRFPDWSYGTMRRWRILAERLDKLDCDGQDALLAVLERFLSSKAALEYPALPEPVQRRVVDAGAWTWSEFRATVWRAEMDDHLEGCDPKKRDHACGDELQAIEEVSRDPDAPEALKDAARDLYERHRDEFARLEDEDPAVVDVEVGIEWKEPRDDKPKARLMEVDAGRWLMTWTGQGEFPFDELRRLGFVDIRHVPSRLEMWNGGLEPITLAAYPVTSDGPIAAAWQRAVKSAGCREMNATTLAKRYGETL